MKLGIVVPAAVTIIVAPLVGAWIEITITDVAPKTEVSLPSWERGLKFVLVVFMNFINCRSPRGSVD